MIYLSILQVLGNKNGKLIKEFDHLINIPRAVGSTIDGSTVVDYHMKGNGSIWQSTKSQCEEGCTLSVTTEVKLSPKYKCNVFFQFGISTSRDEYVQGGTYSNCVLVNEMALPLNITYVDSSVKFARDVIGSSVDLYRAHNKDAIKKYFGFMMRLNTYFLRFKFEKAFEIVGSKGFEAMITETSIMCFDGIRAFKCGNVVSAAISAESVLVLKYLPTVASSTILYLIVDRNHTAYNFNMYYIKPSYFSKKRKTYFRSVKCGNAVSCFSKLSFGFKKLEGIAEMH